MRNWNLRTLKNYIQGDVGADLSLDKDSEDNVIKASLNNSSNSIFEVGIVEEVISNPYDFFNRRINDETTVTVGDVFSGRVKQDNNGNTFSTPYLNPEIVDYVPANSISVFLNSQKSGGGLSKSILCLPFFSSHLMLPVKPGETVWVMKFNENVYYWICRQSSLRQIEDTNFTFSQREENIIGVSNSKDEKVYTHFNSARTKGKSLNFQNILNNSIAIDEEFKGEPVPRQVKDCGDFLIQGSNNSHIYLGKEKFEEPGTTVKQNIFTSVTDTSNTNQLRKPISPAIDLCVLRKAQEIFELKDLADSKSLGSSITIETDGLSAAAGLQNPADARYYENEKVRDKLGKQVYFDEFYDSDIYNCTARLYLSNAKSIDDILFAPNYSREPGLSASPQNIKGNGDYGVLAAISSNTRVIGTETLKIQNIAGSSGIQFTPNGDIIIFANSSGGAKIILEAGGDIRIVPGENGVLKLGSDDANGAVISSDNSETTNGLVTALPIATTNGGLIAEPSTPSTGLYSNKVLISV